MAAPKRTKGQRERDLVFIEPLYAQGLPMRKIAELLGDDEDHDYTLSVVTIKKDIDKIVERWREKCIIGVDRLKAAELVKLNQVEQEAWSGWAKSQKDKVKEFEEEKTGTKESGSRSYTSREGQAGDPRFLDVVGRCIEKRCKILGLDAPITVEGELTVRSLSDLTKAAALADTIDATATVIGGDGPDAQNVLDTTNGNGGEYAGD